MNSSPPCQVDDHADREEMTPKIQMSQDATTDILDSLLSVDSRHGDGHDDYYGHGHGISDRSRPDTTDLYTTDMSDFGPLVDALCLQSQDVAVVLESSDNHIVQMQSSEMDQGSKVREHRDNGGDSEGQEVDPASFNEPAPDTLLQEQKLVPTLNNIIDDENFETIISVTEHQIPIIVNEMHALQRESGARIALVIDTVVYLRIMGGAHEVETCADMVEELLETA